MATNKESMLRRCACKAPVPLAGLMLGLSSAGNMVPDYRPVFGVMAGAILIILLARIVLDVKGLKEELKNPAIVGIACTIPMAVSILSTYTKPTFPDLSYAVWIGAVIVHFALMVYFTKAFMLRFDPKKALPSYFIVYVGVAIGAVIAPAYGEQFIGQMLFWFGFISYLILLPVILYRTVVVKSIPEPLVPTIAIFAAPASLCLAGYLRSFDSKDMIVVSILFGLSIVSYLAVLFYMPKMVKPKFYPSCSAFTFPMVISAIATNSTYTYLKGEGRDIPVLQYLAWAEIGIALIFIGYVLLRYTDNFVLRRGKVCK